MTINIPNFHLNSIGPELILTVTAIVILLLDALSPLLPFRAKPAP